MRTATAFVPKLEKAAASHDARYSTRTLTQDAER